MPYKFSSTDVPLYFGCSPTRGIVDAESSTQLNLYLNPKLLSWIFDCLQTDCSLMVMFSSSLGVVLFLKHMDIFNIQDVLFNIAFPYTALNVHIPHVACRVCFLFFFSWGKVLFGGIYLYFRKSQAGQMELWSPWKAYTCF